MNREASMRAFPGTAFVVMRWPPSSNVPFDFVAPFTLPLHGGRSFSLRDRWVDTRFKRGFYVR
jgi:hypothetical protein